MGDKKIKAVFLDLGNVVVKIDLDRLIREWGAVCGASPKQTSDYFMISDNMTRYTEGKLNSSQFYNRTRKMFGMDIKFDEFYRIWNDIFLPFPETEEIIKTFKTKYPDIKLTLVSNTNEQHFEFIKTNFRILGLFDFHVVSHELRVQKPHPGIFQEAMKLSGSIPKQTFFTDDREDLIQSARVLGIHAFLFTGPESLRASLAKFDIIV